MAVFMVVVVEEIVVQLVGVGGLLWDQVFGI